jgi:ABC-2 type transport system permease protein
VRGFVPILKRELFSLFVTPLAWVLIALFLFYQGFHFMLLVSSFAGQGNVSEQGPLQLFLGGTILHYLPILLLCPLLTMRAFSEERRSGTIEALLTAPVTPLAVVLAKYVAAFLMYLVMWAPTIAYAWILSRYGGIEARTVLTAYLAIFLTGMGYIAIGIMTSALTSSQLVAALVSSLTLVALFTASMLESLDPGTLHDVGHYVSISSMMNEFARGVIDSRRLVFVATLVVVPLFFTVRTVESWRWG